MFSFRFTAKLPCTGSKHEQPRIVVVLVQLCVCPHEHCVDLWLWAHEQCINLWLWTREHHLKLRPRDISTSAWSTFTITPTLCIPSATQSFPVMRAIRSVHVIIDIGLSYVWLACTRSQQHALQLWTSIPSHRPTSSERSQHWVESIRDHSHTNYGRGGGHANRTSTTATNAITQPSDVSLITIHLCRFAYNATRLPLSLRSEHNSSLQEISV